MNKQPYKYQGIELEKHFGLEQYETFYRGLDPQLGRFNSVDPLADIFSYQSPYASMDNNPVSNTDPDGSYSRFGAWWRNIAWGGDGTEKVEKTGEWGVRYTQEDGVGEFAGSIVTRLQTSGSKVLDMDGAREEAKEAMDQFQWQEDNGIVSYDPNKGGYVRNVDGSSLDEPISNEARAKSLANMLSITSFNTAPGVLTVPAAANSLKVGAGGDKVWQPIFRWGKGADKAREAAQELSKADIKRIKNAGVTLKQVKDWKNFYLNTIDKGGKLNHTAIERSNFMQKIIEKW